MTREEKLVTALRRVVALAQYHLSPLNPAINHRLVRDWEFEPICWNDVMKQIQDEALNGLRTTE